jgi:hypothetical protein
VPSHAALACPREPVLVWVWTSIRISECANIEGMTADEVATSKNILKYLAPGGALEMPIENSMSMQCPVRLHEVEGQVVRDAVKLERKDISLERLGGRPAH